MRLSKNFAQWWLSEEFAYTFSIFVELGESIFSALVESGRFFLWKLLIPIIGDMDIVSDCRGPCRLKMVSPWRQSN